MVTINWSKVNTGVVDGIVGRESLSGFFIRYWTDNWSRRGIPVYDSGGTILLVLGLEFIPCMVKKTCANTKRTFIVWHTSRNWSTLSDQMITAPIFHQVNGLDIWFLDRKICKFFCKDLDAQNVFQNQVGTYYIIRFNIFSNFHQLMF